MSFVAGRTVTLKPGEGRTFQAPGHPTTFKATTEDTAGAYLLLEVALTGGGPPQHIHHREEEAFYILEGEVNVKIGEETLKCTVGSYVLIPRGTVHTFWNAGATPAKFLAIVSPPAGFEQMAIELFGAGEMGADNYNPRIMARLMAISQKYGRETVGPPLG